MGHSKNKKRIKLDIVPVKTDDSLKHPDVPHPVLPQHEFALLIVAPKGSGKTNLICNLILNHYKGYFHKILVASPTVDNDEKWDVVKETKNILLENKKLKSIVGDGVDPKTKKNIPKIIFGSNQDPDTRVKRRFDGKVDGEKDFVNSLEDIMPRMEEQNDMIQKLRYDLHQGRKAKFVSDRILVIMDDQAGLFKGGNTRNPIVNFVLKHRHYNTSLIIVTQAYKAIPKTIRVNCNQMICFDISNQAELDAIYEEHPCDLKEDEWLRMFKYATAKPYSFLYVNDAFPKGERCFMNFSQRIVTKNSLWDEQTMDATPSDSSDSEKE